MKNRRDLTQGNIIHSLVAIALPIMSTSFMQMAYNLMDMLWIGRLGYNAVSAVGTAGFYMWLSMSLVRLSQTGAEIGVSQSLGAKNEKKARGFARSALQLTVITSLVYAALLLFFKDPLIDFFNVPSDLVNRWAKDYLSVVAIGMPFSFANLVFSSIYNGSGNSKVPFLFNLSGLTLNLVLDPLLIFGLFGLPRLGVLGAAYATVIAQLLVIALFIWHVASVHSPFSEFHFFKTPQLRCIKQIVAYGFPMAVQSAAFTFFAMLIARRLSYFGDMPIAIQKVGSQIESISWMTAQGFSAALSAFVGQNYGAKLYARVRDGYYEGLKIMFVWGMLSSLALIVFAEPIFYAFIQDPHVLPFGKAYLQILGVSQLFMCIEISTNGAFNGLGLTVPPSVISIFFTGLRVPFAYVLSQPQLLGLNGVWWSISLSSVIKGLVALIVFMWILKYSKRLATP